jgi:hypothetical protein
MKKTFSLIKSILFFTTLTIFILSCSSKNSSPDKFLGKWKNNGASVGEIYKGSTCEITSQDGNIIVHFKGGGDNLQNTGTFKDGKIDVTLSWMGQTQIAYSDEDGQPHIYLFGAKLDKAN